MYIPILDSGHGKMINGIYQTAGKRSPNWSKGILYEGMFNNWVVNRVIEQLDRKKIPYYHISPEYRDVSLETRDKRIKKIWETNKSVYLLSIHANAGGGTGIEGFTTKGYTTADPIAERFLAKFEEKLKMKMRFDFSDGDRDKEANYYMLRKPPCPCFLLECGFMDFKEDYEKLWDEGHLKIMTKILVKVIEELYNELN